MRDRTRATKVNAYDKLIAWRLQKLRAETGETREEVAKAVNVSIQQYAKYENAVNRISAGKLEEVAKYFKMDIRYFYGKLNYKQSPVYKPLKKLVHRVLDTLEKATINFKELSNELEQAERDYKDE